MALTPSTMVPLGTPMPAFALPDPHGELVCSDDFDDHTVLVVAFLSNHCPYVKHLKTALAAFSRDLRPLDAGMVAINSNDAEAYPADSPERMADDIRRFGYDFPYLVDASQNVARAFHAACTPDFFVYGPDRTLFYRGQFDDSRPGGDAPITGADLRAAVQAALAGSPPPEPQTPSMGCNIKWRGPTSSG